MDARRQINLHFTANDGDASVVDAIDAQAAAWGVSSSEAVKRILQSGLGCAVAPAAVQPATFAPAADTTALIQAIAALTQEIIALRKANATLTAQAPRMVAHDTEEQICTEADLNLDAGFLADIKRKARPGMRMEH